MKLYNNNIQILETNKKQEQIIKQIEMKYYQLNDIHDYIINNAKII